MNLFHTLIVVPFLCLLGWPACAQPAKDTDAARWLFRPEHVDLNSVKDQAGSSNAAIEGPVIFDPHVTPASLLIDRDNTLVEVEYRPGSPALPVDALTAEVWVRVEKTVEWCGLIGAIQDNGDFQKGWMLGIRQSNFSFGLASEGADDGDGRLTYIRSRHSLEWGQWYHVAGTYDGKHMKVYVNGELEDQSSVQSGKILYPESARYLIGAFIDDNENFRMRALISEARIHSRALSNQDVRARYEATANQYETTFRPILGPYLNRIDRHTAVIRWETSKPMPSRLVFGNTFPLARVIQSDEPTTRHQLTIDQIEADRLYHYRILSDQGVSRLYEFDSSFDYTPIQIKPKLNPYPIDDRTAWVEAAAQHIVRESKIYKGYCLIVGLDDGRLAYELARRTDLQIVAVDNDPTVVARARKEIDRSGLYGVRVTAQQADLKRLPFPDYFANLIVSERHLHQGELPDSTELFRVLRPSGGMFMLGWPAKEMPAFQKTNTNRLTAWRLELNDSLPIKIDDDDGYWVVGRRGRLPGSGDWTHMYGNESNTSSNVDEYPRYPMRVAWFGRPGPRPMVDRGTRSPAPLSINGRLFIQGDQRIFALDAYNGTILWTLEIPDLRRANIPRDSSNMVADDDRLYVVVRNACWVLDAQTGDRINTFFVTDDPSDDRYEWGYLSRFGELLLGSAVRKGAAFIGADGEWYDASNEESYKVTSDHIFSIDPETGKRDWNYRGVGPIINSTITVGDHQVYFIEGRSAQAISSKSGRLYKELQESQTMVALSALTGVRTWEGEVNVNEGRWVLYMSYANDTLLVLSTTDQYHLYAFDAKNGQLLWNQDYKWYRDHHGGAMQHPVIVNDLVYAEPRVFRLKTGEPLDIAMPERNKCGIITASAHALLYRDFWHAMWDLEQNKRVDFYSIRPGCWLNMIPAGGMVLAPEASAGCYCTHPIQTSIAFIPKGDTP